MSIDCPGSPGPLRGGVAGPFFGGVISVGGLLSRTERLAPPSSLPEHPAGEQLPERRAA